MASPDRRLPALDGLRGLAILSVLGWHYVASTAPWDVAWGRAAHALLAYAWCGVDLFFVLSGFLIGGIVLEHRRAPNFLRVFYARRALRILPLYWVVLAAFAASAVFLSDRLVPTAREWLHGNPKPLLTYLLFGQNLSTALFTPTLAEPGWVNVTWSLAVEEHFYLLGPLAIGLLPARALPWALGAAVAAGPAIRALVVATLGDASVYPFTPCRVDAIVLGVLCAWAIRRPGFRAALRPAPLYAAAAALAAALVTAQLVDVGRAWSTLGYSVVALLSATLLLLAVVEERGPVAAALRWAPLRRAGVLAYGLYLLHQPVNGLAHALLLRAAPGLATAPAAAVTLGALAVTAALAELSWRFLERPLIALGQGLRYADPSAVEERRVDARRPRRAA